MPHIPELRGGESHPRGALAGQGRAGGAKGEERGARTRERERFNGPSGNARGARAVVVPPLTAADSEEEEEKLLAAPAASTGARALPRLPLAAPPPLPVLLQ